MTTTWAPLDTVEIVTWLNAIIGQLHQGATGPVRDELVAELRRDTGASAPFRILAALALLDDCLRIAHLAAAADGVIEDHEVARTLPLARVAAPRFFALLPQYEAFGEPELSAAELISFMRIHREGRGPFGDPGPSTWRGVRLCKRIAAQSHNEAPARDLERMLVRIMDAVFADRDSASERRARDKLRGLFESAGVAGVDPRVTAFCRADAPEVFASVAHGAQVFERDPFDVDTIHGDARTAFASQLEHAITPVRHGQGHGRTLLVLGGAGSGKTHLLRAFRTSVHERGLGYVGYLQMSSDVGDYARYVLTKLIDSLERPYNAPDRPEPALVYLSDGLIEHDGAVAPALLERLRTSEVGDDEFPTFIGQVVDQLVRVDALRTVDSDLIHALVLLQRRDPALQRRIIKYLRCEPLTTYEQGLLGGLAPRLQPEDPVRMVTQLGHLAFQLHAAALVLLVDQIEDEIPDAQSHERIQRAFDALRQIADALPSALVVVACLDDVYDQIRPRLSSPVVDRLERDPGVVRLTAQRSRSEIEVMLARRLEFLYDAVDVGWRDDEALFPFQPEQLDELSNQKARDCLAYFRKYQERCIASATLVPTATAEAGVPPATLSAGVERSDDTDALERAWNDVQVESTSVPDDDVGLLHLLEGGVAACAEELGLAMNPRLDTSKRARLTIASPGRPTRIVEICNRQAQGGHLGRQLVALHDSITDGEIAIALRTSEFSHGPKTQTAKQLGALIKAGGLALAVEDGDLRATLAFTTFAARSSSRPGFQAWRRRARPLARLALFRRLLDLDQLPPSAPPAMAAPGTPATAPTISKAPPPPLPSLPPLPRPAPPAMVPAANLLHLGVTPTMRGEAVTLEAESLKVHAAFLGTTGSGKTTIALNIVEQLLERGISVMLVDRKGDLARYASGTWWAEVPTDPAAAQRKQALRAKVQVDLYTPGESTGRPIRIPIVPAGMPEMTPQERDQVSTTAAGGLAAMIGYGRADAHKKRTAILKKAIELHADTSGATLDDLRDTISRPDPELLAAVGNLTRHFSAVAEDLDTLAIQRGQLLSGGGEVLDVQAMMAPLAGKTRLTIISAVALTDVAVLQFFVSRLLVELARMVRRNPAPTLRTVALFDEADIYIPAVSSPPTKEPMFELLRRARSGGLGVFLATQNPGDLDYKARDNIATWLIGRVAQARAIDKMRNLIGAYPNVAVRLAQQTTGSFFLINPALSATARELRADQAIMKTQQLEEHEIAALARATASP
ncbi:MAG: DUF853 family protein [Myxococcales bacterium]|nr:DUF853 family protein [Myxococcales bacterium]